MRAPTLGFCKCSYFDAETIGLDIDGMLADLEAAPEGSVILLHGGPRVAVLCA